jgi:two-component system sensor histidine kinase TctE
MSGSAPTLRGQLLRGLLLPLAAVWILSAVITYYFAKSFSNLAYDRALFDSTRSLAAQIKLIDHQVQVDLPKEAQRILRYDDYDVVYYQVRVPDGKLLAGDSAIPPPPTNIALTNTPIYYDSEILGKKVRVASLFWPVGDVPENREILVQVAETLVKRKILEEELLTGIVLPQLFLISLAAFSIWYGISKGLTPLSRLKEAISNRSHRDLSPIPEQNIPMEIRPIIHSINDLMTRLSDVMAAQQRFIADASHQLRTPLAGLQAQTELALRQDKPEDLQHTLRQIFIGAERASHLAKQLLTLAKAEPGSAAKENFKPIDLASVAREVTAKWVFQALRKNLDLGFEGSGEPLMIQGYTFLIEELLGNLIDNAIKYSPNGGHITITAARMESPVIIVEDNGIGIPAEDRERVLDRFHRVLGTGVDGSGLGLSIAKEITLSHHGELKIETGAGGRGTRIVVRFPEMA